uniref:Uncharacterized protein n=1 Tax=Panagrolaimus sp. ES5 TaxID=591445 RepID=A0AC34FH15_9BILA
MDTSAADSAATMNAMNILQQFSQLLFLQSLAAGKSSMPFNPSMYGLPPQPQQEKQHFSSTSTFSTKLPKLPPTSPGNVSMQNQTIADILASHQNLKSELCSPTTSTSSTSEYSPFKLYENVNFQQPRQYKVHV